MVTTVAVSLFSGLVAVPANAVNSNHEMLPDEVSSVADAAAKSVGIDTSIDITLTPEGEELVAQTLEGTVTVSGSEGEPTVISGFDDAVGAESSMILPENDSVVGCI